MTKGMTDSRSRRLSVRPSDGTWRYFSHSSPSRRTIFTSSYLVPLDHQTKETINQQRVTRLALLSRNPIAALKWITKFLWLNRRTFAIKGHWVSLEGSKIFIKKFHNAQGLHPRTNAFQWLWLLTLLAVVEDYWWSTALSENCLVEVSTKHRFWRIKTAHYSEKACL